ncbi:MAG: hypothetical protein Q7S32_00120 [bacterium]|nr:hypothetical protein [bacterium]
MDRERWARILEAEVLGDPYRSLGVVLFAISGSHRDTLLLIADKLSSLQPSCTGRQFTQLTEEKFRKSLVRCSRQLYKKDPQKLPHLAKYILEFTQNELENMP